MDGWNYHGLTFISGAVVIRSAWKSKNLVWRENLIKLFKM